MNAVTLQRLSFRPFLLVALVGLCLSAGCGDSDGDSDGGAGSPAAPAPEGWDLANLPHKGTPLKGFKTPGGVVVQVLAEGRGEPVGTGVAMDIHYVGYALSGAIFDRGLKASLVLGRSAVIPGWTEGLAGIRLMEKRRLLVPSAMAYGEAGRGNIPPGAPLVFDVRWVRLDIDDLKPGTGTVAKRGSKVTVHYKGSLENGTTFDSSYERGEPIAFGLHRGPGGVIDGWVRGIAGMKVGGVRKLWIPWHMAYADRPPPKSKIPPYANLVFVVELLDVK